MGFLSNLFNKDKKKEEKQDKRKKGGEYENSSSDDDRFSIHRTTRSSMHFGDRFLSNPTACYQSVGKKYPKGARSCPGAELSDNDSPVREMPFRLRTSLRQSSQREDRKRRNSAFPDRRDPSRYRHLIDTSSGDEEILEYRKNIHDRLVTELQEIKKKYRGMKAVYRQEKNESENDKRINNEVVDSIRRENKELEKQNEALRAELEKLKFSFKRAESEQMQRTNQFNTSIDHQGLLVPRTSTPSPPIGHSFGHFPYPSPLVRPASSSRADTVRNYRMSSATPPIVPPLTGEINATFTVPNASSLLLSTESSLKSSRVPQGNRDERFLDIRPVSPPRLHQRSDSNLSLRDYEFVNDSELPIDNGDKGRNEEDN